MNRGKLLVLSGISSVGKDAIRERLLQDPELKLYYSVSMTTRPQKTSEKDGDRFYFVNHEAFSTAVKEREFLEFNQVLGYYYGTPAQPIDFLRSIGKNVLVETEAQGACQIRLKDPSACIIFITPENYSVLEKNIRATKNENENQINQRLDKARSEMNLTSSFQFVIVNHNLDDTIEQIKKVFLTN